MSQTPASAPIDNPGSDRHSRRRHRSAWGNDSARPRINLQQLDAICAAIDSDLRGQGASHPSSQPAQRLANAVQQAAAQNGVPIAAADVVQALQTYRLNPADLEPARLRLLLTVLAGDQALRAHEAFTVLDEEATAPCRPSGSSA
jgi:hypothetical protein